MKFFASYPKTETTGQFLRWAFSTILVSLVLMVGLSALSSIAGHWNQTLGGALLEVLFAALALLAAFTVLVYVIMVSTHMLREMWRTRP